MAAHTLISYLLAQASRSLGNPHAVKRLLFSPVINVNLACGDVYVPSEDWLNLDYVSNCSIVQSANLLERLPLADCTADLVYSSHFLEHIPSQKVNQFLQECLRILRPGGLLRLVVPDLENICRTYLHNRDQLEHDKADFVILELLDQCVRSQVGGKLGIYYQSLKDNPESRSSIEFVRARTGEDLIRPLPARQKHRLHLLQRLPAFAERLWIRAVIQALPQAFRYQNISMADVGERHHWIYDFYSLGQLLSANGFIFIDRFTASTSRRLDFPFYPLDLAANGQPRKGNESLFIEAQRSQ